MSYRVMAIQETGEEICIECGIRNEPLAYEILDQAREDYIEFCNFHVERELDYLDYYQEEESYHYYED